MANSFSKEERVAFEDILEGFNDQLVASRLVNKYRPDSTGMERANDTIWRPQPYIVSSFNGLDQTANFSGQTQLSVPATLGFLKSVPWTMDSKELRDSIQEKRLGEAAKQRLASDINVAINDLAATQGTLVVKRTTSADFDGIAAGDALMNEQGVNMFDRCVTLSSRDYNDAASDLAARNTVTGKTLKAYEKAYIGETAGFSTYKMDYANSLPVAAGGGGITIDTQVGAANFYVPAATVATVNGTNNVDNRYDVLTVSSTTSVAAGDCFTIAGVNAVHHITKGDTGQLKTFRVISVDSGTTMTVSPPIISNQGASVAEAQYQNCVVTPSATAAIVFLNTATASVNPFWTKDAIELISGRLAVPTGSGAAVMRGTTEQGIEVVWQKQYDIATSTTKYRLDCLFGTVMTNPEMAGILLFNQV